MARRAKTKTAVLILTAMVLAVSLLPLPVGVGLYVHCPIWCRLVYPFLHASFWHALINCWCLLSVVFMFPITMQRLLAAYVVAATVPVAYTAPVVGMSGLCFVLFGGIALMVRDKLYYQAWALGLLTIGSVFTSCAAWVHTYCYLAGLVLGLIWTKR